MTLPLFQRNAANSVRADHCLGCEGHKNFRPRANNESSLSYVGEIIDAVQKHFEAIERTGRDTVIIQIRVKDDAQSRVEAKSLKLSGIELRPSIVEGAANSVVRRSWPSTSTNSR